MTVFCTVYIIPAKLYIFLPVHRHRIRACREILRVRKGNEKVFFPHMAVHDIGGDYIFKLILMQTKYRYFFLQFRHRVGELIKENTMRGKPNSYDLVGNYGNFYFGIP